MKRFFDRCRPIRQGICLLVAGVLPEPEKNQTLNHLAACPDCQKYYAEIKSITAPLLNWEESVARLQPEPAVQARWAKAIHAAGKPETVGWKTPTAAFSAWFQDVIWPYRRIWTGLATVWLLIFAGHISLREQPQITVAKSSPRLQQQMIMALKDRQTILAELLADHSVPRDADRPKFFSPKPRTEHVNVLTA